MVSSKMDSATISSMCRCCAAEGIFKDIKTSYHWMGEEEVYGDMLRECFDVKLISVEEGGICEVCITQLRNASNFKKQVLHTEKKFKRLLDSRRFNTTEVKEELSGEENSTSDDNDNDRDVDNDNIDDEDYVPEFEMPIKTESADDTKSRKRAAKASTSRAKKSRLADDEDKSIVFSDVNPIKEEVEWDVDNKVEVKWEDDDNCELPQVTVFESPYIENDTVQGPNNRGKKTRKPRRVLEKKTQKVKSSRNKSERNNKFPCKIPSKKDKIKPPVNDDELVAVEKHRYNIRTVILCSNATPIRAHYAGNGYACCFCDKYFHKAADLKSHTIQNHDENTKRKFMHNVFLYNFFVKLDITRLRCNVCAGDDGLNTPKEMHTLDELIAHLNSAHNKGIHTDITNQIMCFKLDDELFRCFVCSFGCHSFKNLLQHAHTHYRNFICEVCNAGFITRLKLYGHAYKHKSVGAHKCDTCQKVFDTPMKLKTHERIHSGTMMYKCQQCGEKFSKKNAKRDHMILVHRAEFVQIKCTACEKTFVSKAALSIHINRDHLMDRPHECTLCDKKFFTSAFLRDHMVSHSRVREFKCQECPKTYARKKTLREHMKLHTGDRRFKCTYCDMAFLQKCSLKGHLRSRHDACLQ